MFVFDALAVFQHIVTCTAHAATLVTVTFGTAFTIFILLVTLAAQSVVQRSNFKQTNHRKA